MQSHSHHHGLDHGHDQGHSHQHTHHRIRLAFFLNLFFALIELLGGIFANSFAVTSNALHDLGDSLALALSIVLEKKSHRKSDAQFSYGYRRFSIAAAFITSLFLVSGSCLVIFFGIHQLFELTQPKTEQMMGFSVLGILVNGFSLWTMSKGKSLNEKVLSWHFVEDTLSWVLVLLAGALIRWTNWFFLDVILGMGLSFWILWNVQKNVRQILRIFLQAVPKNITPNEIESSLMMIPVVGNVHHLHLWTLDGELHILTAHILLKKDEDFSQVVSLKAAIKVLLKEKFGIYEATLEFESPSEYCRDPVHL